VQRNQYLRKTVYKGYGGGVLMDWKSMAIGMTHAIDKGLPEMEEREIQNERLAMEREMYGNKLAQAKREQALMKTIAGHVDEYRNAVTNMPAGPAIGGTLPHTTSTPAPSIPTVSRSGQPNLDSGAAVEVHNPTAQPDHQATPLPLEMQRNDPVANPPQNTQVLQKRGEMMMKIHDTLLANGRFDEANKFQKAEFDNIFQIAKISPQGAIQSWNSNPWITQKYGTISPQHLAQKGEWTFLKFGNDGLVRWNKQGQFEIVQKPSGKSETQYSLVGNTPDGRPVNHDKTTGNYYVDGRPYNGRVLPKVEKVIREGGGGSGGGGDLKEFRKEVAGLNSLYKSRATIEKGYDPITGQVIPQDQITTAKATIQGQIERQEGIMQIEYPGQWEKYTKKERAAIGGKGKTGPTDANKEFNINKAADYFHENTMKYGQKAMYDTLIKAGYSEDSIKRAWKRYKGISD
jgi:hypothetical protein